MMRRRLFLKAIKKETFPLAITENGANDIKFNKTKRTIFLFFFLFGLL
jgi:hypothetical protein